MQLVLAASELAAVGHLRRQRSCLQVAQEGMAETAKLTPSLHEGVGVHPVPSHKIV